MNYLFKKIGFTQRSEGFLIEEIEQNDCVFWQSESKIFFGKPIPSKLSPGDILIQEVSSCLKHQNHAIVGVFKCLNQMQTTSFGPHTCDEEKNKWTSFVQVQNLTPKFSQEAKQALQNNKPMLLNLDKEWKMLGNSRLPYYSAGWAYVPQQQAKQIIEKIMHLQQAL